MADRSTDLFTRKLYRCLALIAQPLQHAVLDFERLRSHIKRIAFYTQPEDDTQTVHSDHLLPPSSDERRGGRRTAPGDVSGTKERAKRHHDLFWNELRRQVEVMNTAYGREEKECRRLLVELSSSESTQQQRTAEVCRYLAQHCTSPNAATHIHPPPSLDLQSTFHSALRLCSSLAALSHFLFVSYLVLWRAVGKYNKHTGSTVDQRQLAAFPSSPFTAPPRLSSLLSKANALFALQSSASSTSTINHCPLCLLDSPHLLHLQCHSLCFNCCVRQPSFGSHCPQCRREEDVQADSVEVGLWVSLICKLRVDDLPASTVKAELSYGAAVATAVNEAASHEVADAKGGNMSGRLRERRLTVKVGDVELASLTPSLRLAFPPSPLSASSTTSDASYLSSPSSASLSVPVGPLRLPPSPGPNASPTSSSAFDEFFALHFRPKRGQGVSCHQCKTNKDPATLLFCANREEKGVRRRRCRKKYCQMCLRRSYPLHVLVREDGRDWHCPSCVGVCCCAACQRKESPVSASGSDEQKGTDSPPVISLTSNLSSAAHTLPHSARVRRETSDGGRHEKRVKRETANSGSNHLALTSPMHLSFSSSSPPLTYFHHTMPSLEPLSSPISPDSISHSLAHSSPGFSSLPDQQPPSMEEWERALISTMPGSTASLQPSTTVHHAHVRPLMPPPPANSLLAAINAPAGLLQPVHQELDARRTNSAPPDAIRRTQRYSLSGSSQSSALPSAAHDAGIPLQAGRLNQYRSSRSSLSISGGNQPFELQNPYSAHHSQSQPLPTYSYSAGTATSSPTAALFHSSQTRSTSLDFNNLTGDSFLSIQSLSSSPLQHGFTGAQYSFPDLPPASHSYSGEVDSSAGLKSGAAGRADEQLWSAVDELFAP